MAELILPRYLLTQVAMPHGVRHSKKPTLPRVELVSSNKASAEYTPEEFKGIFENWEYRFWAMTSWPNGGSVNLLTECRACGNVGGNDTKERRQHTSKGGCCKRLIAAYKLLTRDARCIMCNMKTTKQKWGVLICSNYCMKSFCEAEAQPKALGQALALVGEV